MSHPRNTEPQANGALARALMKRHPLWDDTSIHPERTGILQGSSGLQVDILIHTPALQPVAVETEFAPAATVENDATSRLGWKLQSTGETIESAISVVLPEELKTGSLAAIETSRLRYATHHLHADGHHSRWPDSGYIDGTADDLADAIEIQSLSRRKVEEGVRMLEATVRSCAGLLAQQSTAYVQRRLAEKLKQSRGEQTLRMVAAILTSAFVFHASIEGQENLPSLSTLRGAGRNKESLLDTWDAILAINYWPIFSIAKSLLEEIQTPLVPHLMERLLHASSLLASLGATTYHDLTGRMFQTLISDRKFLATFYTLPPSAALLAELAVARLPVDWSQKDAIEGLQIADFACGTGALLSAVQRAICRRYRRAGGDDLDLHRALMERTMIGMDIMPAATHLTCSMLSSAHPRETFGKTNIHTMPYGIDSARKTHIGALDLIDVEQAYSLFATGEAIGGQAPDTNSVHSVTVKNSSCDLVIMNPPFTRPTNHESRHSDIPIPSFAGFSTSKDEQKAMSRKLRRIKAEFGDGNAGLASNFIDLVHRKLKDGGVMALVLPFALIQGKAWSRTRTMLEKHYNDVHIVSIAATGSTDRAFSADTGMAECLVVATKGSTDKGSALFSNLESRPVSLLEAISAARPAKDEAFVGDLRNAGAAGGRSVSVIKTAQSLQTGRLLLPRQARGIKLPITLFGAVAQRGLVHRDLTGGPKDRNQKGRGPFVKRPIFLGEIPTYPMLWAHSAIRERRFVVQFDSCGDPRYGDEERAIERWGRSASRLHANLDFRLNSQSLALCLTPEKCLGGRAWPNITPHNVRHEIPLLLWGNSTLGLLMHWWKGTRQQSGRSIITITAIPELPVLDPNALTEEQLRNCRGIYNRFKERKFLPANESYRDNARRELDRELLFGPASVLQLDSDLENSLDLLRLQWCAEPSVHGGKGTRPRNAR